MSNFLEQSRRASQIMSQPVKVPPGYRISHWVDDECVLEPDPDAGDSDALRVAKDLMRRHLQGLCSWYALEPALEVLETLARIGMLK